MRIEVIRSGGFAGIPRRGAVDTADHPDGARLESLAAEALTPRPSGPPAPDGFRYTITAGPRTIHCTDPQLTGPQRELITAVLA
jgi:hypothetical protein